jgi:hypothetical protein
VALLVRDHKRILDAETCLSNTTAKAGCRIE